MKLLPCIAVALAFLTSNACKSRSKPDDSAAKGEETAAQKSAKNFSANFDKNALDEIYTPPQDIVPAFCPMTSKFSIVNAYWLAVASNDAYGTGRAIEEVTQVIEKRFAKGNPNNPNPFQKLEFLDSDDQEVDNDADLKTKWAGERPKGNWGTQAMWLQTERFVIIAFRGTQTKAPTDLLVDGDLWRKKFGESKPDGTVFPPISYGSAHKGFNYALDSIWSKLHGRLLGLDPKTKIFITGHSLGAALATLAGTRILTDGTYGQLRSQLAGIYTYGSPRAGNETLINDSLMRRAQGYYTVLARFRNRNDAVTRVPILYGYTHMEPTYYLDAANDQTKNIRIYTNNEYDQTLGGMKCGPDWWKGVARSNFSHDDDISAYQDKISSAHDHSMTAYIAKIEHFYRMTQGQVGQPGRSKDICDISIWDDGPNPQTQTYCEDLKRD